jgi:RTX calcium-binding nonapeptide repeat (4 copies)
MSTGKRSMTCRGASGRRLGALLAVPLAVCALAAVARGEASHAGWPPIRHLAQHRFNQSGTLRGYKHVHNELLGGNGNDTIWAGEEGDVIWGDFQPSGQPESQQDYLHGGAGNDFIYASHGHNVIWTGAGNDQLALVYGYGTVFCDGPGLKTLVVRYLPQNRRFRLVGCKHVKLVLYRA